MRTTYILEIYAEADKSHGGPAIAVLESATPFMLPRVGDVIRSTSGPEHPNAEADLGFEVLVVEHYFWTESSAEQIKQKVSIWTKPFRIQ